MATSTDGVTRSDSIAPTLCLVSLVAAASSTCESPRASRALLTRSPFRVPPFFMARILYIMQRTLAMPKASKIDTCPCDEPVFLAGFDEAASS